MRRFAVALPIFSLALGISISRADAQNCSGVRQVSWPQAKPIWTFCWTPPDESGGPDGSGLEIHHAFYKGKRVFWRASVPVLNVLYDPGSEVCGPTYRDWLNSPQAFEADKVLSPGYAEPTKTPKTVCDAPGADVGTFSGVAIQKLADRIVLWTQARAGWYRYIQKISFFADGSIEPGFGFTAVTHPCINKAHSHHGYWRFDFDIDGSGNDRIEERRKFFWFWTTAVLGSETTRLRSGSTPRRWRIKDVATGRGYEVVPGPHDVPGGGSFEGSDVWALLYRSNETDDGGSTGGATGDAQHIDPFVNGEAIAGADVVLWYRIGHRHVSGPTCTIAGPRLVPFGSW